MCTTYLYKAAAAAAASQNAQSAVTLGKMCLELLSPSRLPPPCIGIVALFAYLECSKSPSPQPREQEISSVLCAYVIATRKTQYRLPSPLRRDGKLAS